MVAINFSNHNALNISITKEATRTSYTSVFFRFTFLSLHTVSGILCFPSHTDPHGSRPCARPARAGAVGAGACAQLAALRRRGGAAAAQARAGGDGGAGRGAVPGAALALGGVATPRRPRLRARRAGGAVGRRGPRGAV